MAALYEKHPQFAGIVAKPTKHQIKKSQKSVLYRVAYTLH
jgi:hypothetical protein